VPADPAMMPLMQKTMQGAASKEEMQLFGTLWQDRVKRIFENSEKVITLKEL